MKRNFNEWFDKFRDSIANYKYYIDFEKVHRNVNNIKVELNILNTLIGSTNIENEFIQIISKYPETLNETARSYKMIAKEAEIIDGFTFVWFTDGKGWQNAKHNLEETFDVLDTLYSIDDLENGILENFN